MKEKVIELLSEIRDDVDYEKCDTLMEDQLLSSLDLMQLIGALDDEFDVAIPAEEILLENFNSVDGIVAMLERLSK